MDAGVTFPIVCHFFDVGILPTNGVNFPKNVRALLSDVIEFESLYVSMIRINIAKWR